MDVKLVIQQGRTRTREVRVRPPETVVGRARGCQVRIASAEVSRRHCVLRPGDDGVTVEDLGSSNGTFLNGKPVDGLQDVRPGDRLRVGPVTFLVEFDDVAQALVEPIEEASGGRDLPLAAALDEDGLPAAEVSEGSDDYAPLKVDDEDHLPIPDADMETDPAGQWDMPEGGDLRNLLEGLGGDEAPPKRKKKR